MECVVFKIFRSTRSIEPYNPNNLESIAANLASRWKGGRKKILTTQRGVATLPGGSSSSYNIVTTHACNALH
eukprot:6814960-Pyramimonas_sp.AAC.1